ncbi:MAG: N-acyl homoserine lactonase family protein [Gammaproteobacteria bacterium]|nr:N-acyl homoserine lactonase family protein [Gammaproteobacteria bacterium]MCP5199151.1 N-acyl homoserine lactonase family protein [Gammaproteobacteria bacterium]
MSVQLFAMTCGWLTMPLPMLLDGTEGDIRIPVPVYLVRHPRGTVLFDSGLSPAVQRDGVQALGEALQPYFQIEFGAGEDVAARLASACETDAASIDFLVSSHLHFDHCGGNALVPNARHVVQKREWEAATTPELAAANHFDARDFDHGHPRLLVDGEHDLFGDGTVRCIPTHGHTPGHQSLVVETAGGRVVLCGDACYLRRTIEEMRLPSPIGINDADGMRESLRRLKALQDAGARLMYGHDPEFWREVPQAPRPLV